jgi:hypothetical protein
VDSLADEIRARHKVRIEVIACDLTTYAPGDRLLAETTERRDPSPSWVCGHVNHALALLPRYFTRCRSVLLTGSKTMRNFRADRPEGAPA